MSEKKTKSVLDDVKAAEAQIKKQLLMRELNNLRKLAKRRLEIEEETRLILDEIGITGTDAKKVIDYINEQVKLSESDKESIRKRVAKDVEEEKEEVEDKIPTLALSAIANAGGVDWTTTKQEAYNDLKNGSYSMTVSNTGDTMMISDGSSSDATLLNSLKF